MNVLTHAGVEMRAPAKVNLALHVTGRRSDGYHELSTLVVFTEFGDHVAAIPAETDRFEVTGPYAADVPGGPDNLVVKARDLLREHCGNAASAVAITLRKNLPVASGVGGGSSDAAATVRALVRLWAIEMTEGEIARLALRLGADVPMCLAARPLVAHGIGEDIRHLDAVARLPLVLANPMVALSTPDVFRRLESRTNPPLPPFDEGAPTSVAEAARYVSETRNDLEKPATQFAPVIAETVGALRRGGALAARMSGSGATCFGIFETPEAAARAAAQIRAARPGWFVTDTLTNAS